MRLANISRRLRQSSKFFEAYLSDFLDYQRGHTGSNDLEGLCYTLCPRYRRRGPKLMKESFVPKNFSSILEPLVLFRVSRIRRFHAFGRMTISSIFKRVSSSCSSLSCVIFLALLISEQVSLPNESRMRLRDDVAVSMLIKIFARLDSGFPANGIIPEYVLE